MRDERWEMGDERCRCSYRSHRTLESGIMAVICRAHGCSTFAWSRTLAYAGRYLNHLHVRYLTLSTRDCQVKVPGRAQLERASTD